MRLPASRLALSWSILLSASLAAFLGLGAPARAGTVAGTLATFAWTPATGPVAGYSVWVGRDSLPAGGAPETTVSDTTVSVSGQLGQTVVIQVAAFDAAGNQGPMSPLSEAVFLADPNPPPDPPQVVVEPEGDLAVRDALAGLDAGEQLTIHMGAQPSESRSFFLDVTPPEESTSLAAAPAFGFDQLVVGTPQEPAMVRLVDALSLEGPLVPPVPSVTLFGLGVGEPCARTTPGLRIHPGSTLILGGLDLRVFDGQECVYVNELFADSPDPNVIPWDEGSIQLYGDLDADGVLDPEDNCMLVSNPDQCDSDGNGYGSLCDADLTGDGVVDVYDEVELTIAKYKAKGKYVPKVDLDCNGKMNPGDRRILMRLKESDLGVSGLACTLDDTCSAP